MPDPDRAPAAQLNVAARVRELAPSPTLASPTRPALKAQGIDVIDLGGGDPDFITPAHIRAAATEAMNAGDTHYVASAGIPALRKAIAAKLEARQRHRGRCRTAASSSPPAANRRCSRRCWPWSNRASTC